MTDHREVMAPGTVVLGLEIRRVCGAGGFGTVYEAWDPALLRPVALKTLHSADPRVQRRFRDEGRALARLADPNIVQVYGVGELPTGRPALLMQFVPGGALSDHLRPGVAFATSTAVEVAAQVLSGLAAAHAAGICHRDVKAANVLWSPTRATAMLCDFGIARLLDAPPTDPTAGLVGSRQSLAPERLRGVADDPRSDLFAAGALLYRMLSGREPFDGPPGDLVALAARMSQPPAPLPAEVPAGLARVCRALLSVDPADRPGAADAAHMLRAATGLTDTADAPPGPTPPTAARRRDPRWVLVAGALALGIGAAFALGVGSERPVPETPRPRPEALPVGGSPPTVSSALPTAAPSSAPAQAPVPPSMRPAEPRRAPAPGSSARTPRNADALAQPFVTPTP
jgi:serine/threonine protein kinase